MPIRREFRKFYDRTWRTEIRPRILARAQNRCEQCGKPNHRTVWVWSGSAGQYWTAVKGAKRQVWYYCCSGGWRTAPKGSGSFWLSGRQWAIAREIRVILQVAHLNHVPGDDRDENLRAFCGWCHTNYDKLQHKQTRASRKDLARPLLTMEANV